MLREEKAPGQRENLSPGKRIIIALITYQITLKGEAKT